MTFQAVDKGKIKDIVVLDTKRSNAINIGLTKLPPPRTIKTAILKMDSAIMNKEGIEVCGKLGNLITAGRHRHTPIFIRKS